jgi:RNA polymerase sigma-70 factor (ECF subfamily)
MYFTNYERHALEMRTVRVDGELVLGVYEVGAKTPSYFILLAFDGGKVTEIRDFRYVPYIAREADVGEV